MTHSVLSALASFVLGLAGCQSQRPPADPGTHPATTGSARAAAAGNETDAAATADPTPDDAHPTTHAAPTPRDGALPTDCAALLPPALRPPARLGDHYDLQAVLACRGARVLLRGTQTLASQSLVRPVLVVLVLERDPADMARFLDEVREVMAQEAPTQFPPFETDGIPGVGAYGVFGIRPNAPVADAVAAFREGRWPLAAR